MTRRMKNVAPVLGLLLVLGPAAAWAQNYDSGSDGSLGALVAPALETTEILLPPDGVLHYTSVSIPDGAKVVFKANADNTPVTLLAQDGIVIAGEVSVDGGNGTTLAANAELTAMGGTAGPGGAPGGHWGTGGGWAGGGPGGAFAYADGNGAPGGASPLQDGGTTECSEREGEPAYAKPGWISGFGGSGGGASNGKAGGGGAGALTIASSISITLTGVINARGGDCWSDAGAGGGGYIRLVAPAITGSGKLDAQGGAGCGCDAGGAGADGYVRLEGFDVQGAVATTASPAAYVTLPTAALPYVAGKRPRVAITSVGSKTPVGAAGGFYPPNLVLPTETQLTVDIEAEHVPAGTVVNIILNTQGKGRTVVLSSPLAGTPDKLTATATILVPKDTRLGSVQAYIPSLTIPKAD